MRIISLPRRNKCGGWGLCGWKQGLREKEIRGGGALKAEFAGLPSRRERLVCLGGPDALEEPDAHGGGNTKFTSEWVSPRVKGVVVFFSRSASIE